LVAAVAFGCAQAGWAVLTPGLAGASSGGDAALRTEGVNATQALATPMRSPFEPALAELEAGSNATSAVLSTVKLSGVRMATDTTRSSAILSLSDGAERAFQVGEEIAEGVRLADVSTDYVLLDYAGGQRQLSIQPQGASFARALMGQAAPPAVPANPGAETIRAAQASSPSDVTPFAPIAPAASQAESVAVAPNAMPPGADWLQEAMAAQLFTREASGLRLTAPAPAAAAAMGLQTGDVIKAVNGASVAAGEAAILAALGAGPVTLAVQRGDTQVSVTLSASAP
jgi:general secretion pathway protein C